jgi:hypothetical protein
MAAPSPHNHATRSEIIDLAAAEGHDADIPTNAGSVHSVASHAPTQPQTTATEKDTTATMEKDVEKGADAGSMTSTDAPEEPAPDPNVVDFDGPNDMENPLNWTFWKKWGMIMLISAITFLTPLASSMFAPGVPEVMREFHSTNDMLEGFMVSVYVLGVRLHPELPENLCANLE